LRQGDEVRGGEKNRHFTVGARIEEHDPAAVTVEEALAAPRIVPKELAALETRRRGALFGAALPIHRRRHRGAHPEEGDCG
jgi:hypothetical protein